MREAEIGCMYAIDLSMSKEGTLTASFMAKDIGSFTGKNIGDIEEGMVILLGKHLKENPDDLYLFADYSPDADMWSGKYPNHEFKMAIINLVNSQ